jgi:protein-S-isoprenylcysteine O-methyltransferase Ste14
MSRLVRAGGWLFRRRTSIPVPLALALLLIPADSGRETSLLFAGGAAIVAAGESLRLWAVRHIGVISRTRSDRLGPLVSSGPFGLVRNPLYLGNIALWVGFAVSARLTWLVPVVLLVLSLEYHAIVRWEEELLTARRGDEYQAYAARVPRWLPSIVNNRQSTADSGQSTVASRPSINSWSDVFFSERGTLIAIAAGYLLLWVKLVI